MLILDVADNLSMMSSGDERPYSPIFVNNDGEMGLALEKRLELVSERGVSNKPRRAL
jgi:hypothetical protein